jgi:ribonuclease P protein component
MNKVNESFPRREGLRGKKNFERVYRYGSVYQTRYLVLFCLREDVEGRRAAFVTSRKLGKAVTRNRIRRRLREAYRRIKANLPDNIYLVFVARKGIAELEWEGLLGEMRALLAKAGLGQH